MSGVMLTADRTMMSSYHSSEFLGFGTCIPPYIFPTALYEKIFFPPVKNRDGIPLMAPYALRKIEAKLLDAGIDTKVVDPDHIDDHCDEAEVIGISVMDPFGWGPASSTFSMVLRRGDVFSARYFRQLLESEGVKRAKRNGAKLIVGGSGAWQFEHKKNFVREHGIDCVFMGEAENYLEDIFNKAMNGEELPEFYDAYRGKAPGMDEISEIKHASVNGLVEIGRGCPRGCPFCDVTRRRLRWYPYDKIRRELEVNKKEGVNFGVIHAEDVLLYGTKGVTPDVEKLEKLFSLFEEYYDRVSWSHTSIAAIAAAPEAIEIGKEKFLKNQDWFGVEIGIETGSPRLIERSMPAKAKPFEAMEWQELVHRSMGILHDSSIVPACTLIIGLPEEREEDIIATIDMMDDLRDMRSLIVPLFFVPLGRLRDENWFHVDELSELQIELLKSCLNHSIRWAKDLARGYNKGHLYSPLLNFSLESFIGFMEFIAKRKRFIKTKSIINGGIAPEA